MTTEFLQFKKTWGLSLLVQIIMVVALFVVTTFYGYFDFRSTGLLFGYPLSISILFVPIYEEIIFRGFILQELTKWMKNHAAIIVSSLLFGIWHLKNIFYLTSSELISQILYTTLIFGPIMAAITLRTKTIWIAVIIHYLYNLLSFATLGLLT